MRAVEEAINPYLEQDRDLTDPDSARVFFTRAALPAVHHVAAGGEEPGGVRRHALYYPAKAGLRHGGWPSCSPGQDEAAADDPAQPRRRAAPSSSATTSCVRLIDVAGALDAATPSPSLGLAGAGKAAELRPAARRPGDRRRAAPCRRNATTDRLLPRAPDMDLVTDRRRRTPDAPARQRPRAPAAAAVDHTRRNQP